MNTRDTLGAALTAWLRVPGVRHGITYLPFVAVCAVLAFLYFTKDAAGPPTILGPYSDVAVLNEDKRVPIGESVNIAAEFCITADAEVHTDVFIRKIGNGSAREPVEFISFDTHRPTGCGPINLSIPITSSLGPGRFNIYGVDTVLQTEETKIWVSSEFEVFDE